MEELPDRPSYFKYAFANVYNLSLLGGVGVAAAATNDWAIAVVAGGLEALWLFIGADTAPFRRWVDRQHRAKQAEAAKLRRRARILALAAPDRNRAIDLLELHINMGKALDKNEQWSGELVRSEYSRLESLLDSWIELAEAVERFEDYGSRLDLGDLRRQLATQEKLAKAQGGDAEARALAGRNAELLEKRIGTIEEMRRLSERTRAQMGVIENTFRLLSDQVASLQPPQDIHGQLDEIIAGVDAVRAVLAQGDQEMQSAAQAPPVQEEETASPPPRNRVR